MAARRNRIVGIATLSVVGVLVVSLWIAYYFGLILLHPTVRGAQPLALPSNAVRVLATNLTAPWGIAFLPDHSALVTERDTARILSVRPDGTVTEVQRLAEVRPDGEGGLLGIAVSPSYSSDHWVYVYFTSDVDNRVARLHLGGPPEPILTGIPKGTNHDGGRIAFGPDGMLYVGTGDAGDSGGAQNLSYLGGKILRITPDGNPAPGNPFPGSPVWSYGHRNVQGLAWDRTGRMFATEFGQNRYDELNLIQAGHDYGWPDVEGVGSDDRYTNPVATWATSDASPSGLAIVGDHAFLACLRGQRLYEIGLDGSDPRILLNASYGRLRAVAEAPDGSLWILTSNRDGRGAPVAADDRIVRLSLAAAAWPGPPLTAGPTPPNPA
jgi:glucose/arabinose dehydrogenase